MYQIETGIPVTNGKRTGTASRYPFAQLQVDQSFLVKDRKVDTVRSAACMASKRLGVKFVVRSVDGGVRVWRVA